MKKRDKTNERKNKYSKRNKTTKTTEGKVRKMIDETIQSKQINSKPIELLNFWGVVIV